MDELSSRDWVKATIKEIAKHAQRDGCYDCKKILRKLDIDPDTIDLNKLLGEI